MTLETLNVADFNPHLSSKFALHYKIQDQSLTLETELIEVQESRFQRPSNRGAGFSLIFRGPLAPILPQQVYQFEHAVMGNLEIFIVPIGPDDLGMRYQAVFN